jgi:tetratricopeptide (TPR) repeat protein
MIRLLLVTLLLSAAPAGAKSAADAFAAGRFQEAAKVGRQEGTAQGYITAGRAIGTQAAWLTPNRAQAIALLREAEADFSAALKKQPGNLDALLQRGIVIGYIAKIERSPNLAKEARRSFETVLSNRPDDPLALGALGGWHGESVASLGKMIAGTMLGAKQQEAFRYYERAVAVKGGDPAVPLFYASTLLRLSPDNAGKAKVLLQRSISGPAGDGFDALMQRNAKAILAALDKGDVDGARAMARKLAPLGSAS